MYFPDPETNRYHEIPYAKQAGPKMSIPDLRKCIGHIKSNGKKITQNLIFETFELQKQLVKDAKKKTKAVLRANTLQESYEKEHGKQTPAPVETAPAETKRINNNPFISFSKTENTQTVIKPFKVYDKRSSK